MQYTTREHTAELENSIAKKPNKPNQMVLTQTNNGTNAAQVKIPGMDDTTNEGTTKRRQQAGQPVRRANRTNTQGSNIKLGNSTPQGTRRNLPAACAPRHI